MAAAAAGYSGRLTVGPKPWAIPAVALVVAPVVVLAAALVVALAEPVAKTVAEPAKETVAALVATVV